jgi:hypothetical protein
MADNEGKIEDSLKSPHDEEQERAINIQLDRLALDAQFDKAKVAGDSNAEWEKYYDLYYGGERHWKNYPGSLPVKITNNKIGRNVEQKVALVSDMKISAEIAPAEPGDEITARLLEAAKQYGWAKRNLQHRLKTCIKDAVVLGTGFAKTWWNPTIDDWDVSPVPPEDFFPAPGAQSLRKHECPYCFYRAWWNRAEVKARWGMDSTGGSENPEPSFREARDTGGTGGTGERHYNMAAAGTTQPTTTAEYLPGRHIAGVKGDDKVCVEEWYLDDPDTKKYARGRMIVRVGRRIVEDKNNPYEDGEWPFDELVDTIVPHRLWGDTTVRQVAQLQRELNVLDSLIVYNTHISSSSIWFTFPGSVSAGELQAAGGIPGMAFTVPNINMVPKRDYPPALPQAILQYRDDVLDSIDKGMRIQEIVPPGSRGWPSSGEVVDKMMEAQQVEIREFSDHVSDFVCRITAKIASRCQQFYTGTRYARILGPLPRALEGLVDPETGELVVESVDDGLHYVKFNRDNLKKGYDVAIVESTWQPLSMKARFDMLMKLKAAFPDDISIEHVLANLDMKGKESILRDKRAAAEAQQAPPPGPEAGMAGPVPGGGMPPGPPPMQGPPPGMM